MPATQGAVTLQRPINRVQPAGPVIAYQSFEIASPLATHWRDARCAEVGCPRADGWVSRFDESTEQGRVAAWHIRHRAGRRYRETRDQLGMTVFTFAAGQRCFAGHKVPVGRPEIYIVRHGDWRGNPTGWRRIHQRPEHWVEHMAEHQDMVATIKQRG